MAEITKPNTDYETLDDLSLMVGRLAPQPGLRTQLLAAIETAGQIARGEEPSQLTPAWDFTIALAEGKAVLDTEEELLRGRVGESLLARMAKAELFSDERFYYKRILRSMGAEVDDPEERLYAQQSDVAAHRTGRAAPPTETQPSNIAKLLRGRAEAPDTPAISWPKRLAVTAAATAVISGVALEAATGAAAAPAPKPTAPLSVSTVRPAGNNTPESGNTTTSASSSGAQTKNGTSTASSNPLPPALQKRPPETVVPLPNAPDTTGPEKAKTQPYIPGKTPSVPIAPADGTGSGGSESPIVITPGSDTNTPNQSQNATSTANPGTPVTVAPGNSANSAPTAPDTTVTVPSSATLPKPSPGNQAATPPTETTTSQVMDPNTVVVSSAPVTSTGGQNILVTPGTTPPPPTTSGAANEMAPQSGAPLQLANTPGAVVTVPSTATPASPATLVPLPTTATAPNQTTQNMLEFLMQNGGSSLQIAQAEEQQLESKYGFIPAAASDYQQGVIADAAQMDAKTGGKADINDVKAIVLADLPGAAAAPEIAADPTATPSPFVSVVATQIFGNTQSGLGSLNGQENYNGTTQGAIETYLAQGLADDTTSDEQNAILSQLGSANVTVTPPPAPTPPPNPTPKEQAPAQTPHSSEILSEQQMYLQACDAMIADGGDWKNRGIVLKYLIQKGLTPLMAAGIGGNLVVESGTNPQRVQDGFAGGPYSSTIPDSIRGGKGGYGLAQWTSTSRLDGLETFAQNDPQHRAVDDLSLQLDYMWYELNHGYAPVLQRLQQASSVTQAASIIMGHGGDGYENPNPDYAHEDKRQTFAAKIAARFNKYLQAIEAQQAQLKQAARKHAEALHRQQEIQAKINLMVHTAVTYAKKTTNPDDHTPNSAYLHARRAMYPGGPNSPWNEADTDCSIFIKTAVRDSIDPHWTGNSGGAINYARKSSHWEVYDVNHVPGGIKPGDILANQDHIFMYVGKQSNGYSVAEASWDEGNGGHVPEIDSNLYTSQDGIPFQVIRYIG